MIIPKDIMFYTPQEVEEWSEVSQEFVSRIVDKETVIYEKEQQEGSGVLALEDLTLLKKLDRIGN